MARRPAAIDGLLSGWALGAWDAGLILSNAQFAGTLWVYVLTLALVAMALYGWGGWLIGRFSPVRPPWAVLVPLGCCLVLYYLHQFHGLPAMAGWPWPLAGGIAALLLYRAAVRGTAEVLPRWVGMGSLGLPLLLVILFEFSGKEPVVIRSGSGADAGDRPNVVLVTWDTVRADTLPLYGGGGLDMPELERLAAEGALFEDFQSAASITAPAHASMLSGLYPPSHGLRANGESLLTEGLPLLPVILDQAGYATGGFVSGYPIRASFGFSEGFQHFDGRSDANLIDTLGELCRFSSALLRELIPEQASSRYTVPGALTVDRAVSWYEQQSGPTFLWVHLFDAHGPYTPPEAFREAALARRDEGPHAVAPELEDRVVLQRGEIAWLDHLLGQLRTSLERRDPGLENTLILLVADHGECFGEGGLLENHEASLFEATQRVPAVIRLPGRTPEARRGERLETSASHVDLAPTILELAELPPLPSAQGSSLVPALTAGGDPDPLSGRGRYMEAYQRRLGDKRLSGWVKDGWKAVWAIDGSSSLYHVETGDRDRAAEEPARLDALLQEGRAFLEGLPVRGNAGMDLDLEQRHALQHLGYLDVEEEE